ncbi:MAG TPA: hypothetical protein VEC96_03310, partial [Anaerolineae bacterium]|nr:hypothetical protein [Anaerolineae bacterium]
MTSLAGNNNQLPNNLTFRPHPLARSPHFQTIVSSTYRNKGAAMCHAAREMILDAGEGVHL